MGEAGPWRGDAVRRGLAKELGVEVADQLQALADDVVEQADQIENPRDRNNMLAFVGLCLAGHMRMEESGGVAPELEAEADQGPTG